MKLTNQAINSAVRKAGLATAVTAGLALSANSALAGSNLYVQEDDSWLRIDGTVKSVSEDSFELDGGDGNITVEMDAGDLQIVIDNYVEVIGEIDDNLFKGREAEAERVIKLAERP